MESQVNILDVNISRVRMVVSHFTLELANPKNLLRVFKAIRRVEGVGDVYRVRREQDRNP